MSAMRITASTAPARTGKQRLLASCAIAAGLAALAFAGPTRAQGVQGGGQVVMGNATISPPAPGATPPNTTNVVTTTNQTIINWTPTDTAPTGAPIDFLPFGNTLNYYGSGQYTVLNRFIAINPLTGLPVPISRQIALNGTVNSYVGSPTATSGNVQGGNIWFYNAGGILIGQRAVINVGSLVLTANDIDTTGGLFGPGGEIRFRGASGSTSSIDISPQSFISAANPGNPGSSYIALVAPRINQGGLIDVDGSAALVAAEQADITINNGLFDINVTVGAEGGNAITHTGVTGGPAHQQGDTDQSRIYLVAIPKNDAVTMLISGQLGYQDAVVAQTDPDGAVVLSAGYNIENGALAAAPANATAANITIADTIFQSSVTARASGDLLAGPLAMLPTGGPVTAAPPPHLGRLVVQGNANFIGDASATLNVGPNQLVGATGNMVVQSNGVGSAAGRADVNVTGGGLAVLGTLNITANGVADAVTGDATGGTASFDITGGTVVAGNLVVSAAGTGGFDATGNGGDGTGGTASLTVETGGSLTANNITVQANGRGGGFTSSITLGTQVADVSGNGQGGTATLVAQNGGSITANASINVNATGTGATGTAQSGNGTGGTATLRILTGGTSVTSPVTNVNASGTGGGTVSLPIFGTFLSNDAGDGTGGTAEVEYATDFSSPSSLGGLTLNAAGIGGGANGANAAGGNATGGDVIIASTAGNVTVDTLILNASALSGGASDSVGNNASSGNAVGGAIDMSASNGATLGVNGVATADASGVAAVADNVGSSTGGDIAIGATGGATVSVGTDFQVNATAGQFVSSGFLTAGSSTGGNIDFTADNGTIAAGAYIVEANANTNNVSGASGAAQGGTIDIRASNNGSFTALTDSATNEFSADAAAGLSAGGTDATGGTIQLIADGGTINFQGSSFFSAGGIAGGDNATAAPTVATGRGGSILIQLLPSSGDVSAISFADAFLASDGSAGSVSEGGGPLDGAASGTGGTVTFDVQAGTLTGNDITASASGFGGSLLDDGGEGRGGTATFTQSGGTTTVNSLTIAADGFGGSGDNGGPSGLGVGGTATINLNSGAIDAQSILASAIGSGGLGAGGDDLDPANPVLPGSGGDAQGGNAAITILGDATVDVQSLTALATGQGGPGGDFLSVVGLNADGGAGGNAVGGNANITLASGTMSLGDVTADASGVGGAGGSLVLAGSGLTVAAAGGGGGNGQGGVALVSTFTDTAGVTGTIGAFASGVGGIGGNNDVGGNGGAAIGGDATIQIDVIDTTLTAVVADAGAFGGNGGNGAAGAAGNGGAANAGNATVVQNAGTLTATDIGASAIGIGGSGQVGGNAVGGRAAVNLFGGTLTATNITAGAAGIGGFGAQGHDNDVANPVDGGTGGDGQGGSALIDLDGSATVNATTVAAFSSGIGGNGGGYFAANGVVGDTGNGGNGFGGDATVRLTAGDLTAGDITADALGLGGNGGNFSSSTAGLPLTGSGLGGNGGTGQGGNASLEFLTLAATTGTVASYSNGQGGAGGNNSVGGIGGAGFGGTAQAVIDNIDAGTLGVLLDSSAVGGDGGTGLDGAGGQGGFGQGGRSVVDVRGIDGRATVTNANFDATGTGGTGGNAFLRPGNDEIVGPPGGNGGDGQGGTVQVLVTDGAATLGVGGSGPAGLASNGVGGDGGRGADNFGSVTQPGPDGIPGTMDDVVVGFFGGTGGIAGAGIGGTVQLTAIGGTISSNGAPVQLSANGQSGNGGDGGDGTGGTGGCCSGFVDQGGTVIIESLNSASNPGSISLGDTTIDANGFIAGRIELIAEGAINMTSLTATAQGFSNPTNNDTDLASTGIFMSIGDGGLIQTDGAVSLDTTDLNGNPGASVGVYAQGTGQLNVGGDLTVNAGDQIDIRHDFRDGTAPTIQTGGSANFTAVTSIRSAPGSLVSAGTSLFMNATGFNSAIDVDSLDAASLTLLLAADGRINVYGTTTSGDDLTANARDEVAINDATAGDDISLIGDTVVAGNLITNGTGLDSELDGSNIFIGTAGAASIDHAEADNDFTADVGSFATGLDTIITGGDIDITSVGAVDLGNSQAGGFIAVNGQSITFNAIEAGTTVGLTATGTAPGAEGILGNSITAGGDVTLFGNTIRINDGVTTSGSLFASSSGGNARLSATTDGDIVIDSTGDIAGTYAAGGNVSLTAATDITAQATAAGTYVGPNGPSEGYLFINAAGDANVLAGTSAATMIGVAAGANANVDGATAGEDLYVLAGNTATVTNSTAGDDLVVTGTCCVIVDNVATTGAGPDGRSLIFGPFSAGGPDMWQIQSGPADLSNIVLTASAGTIDASNAVAFDNLTATASDVVTTTNTIRSGLVTTITGSSLDLESVTAGTDIILTSTAGGISAIGALSAGHDLTIDSATTGQFADLAAGDDIRITASGDVSAASVLTTAGGFDNDIDGSGAYIDTAGNIAITGTTNTAGQTRLTAGGTVDTGAITADFTVIDAVGAVNITGDVISGGIFIEGASIDMQSAIGNVGQIVLRATDGDITADGDVTTLSSLEVDAAGAIAITGTASGGNFVQMQGASIDVADVDSSAFVFLTATGGQINATGTITAGSDVILDAAAGGTLGALVAADDVSITAGGDVTIASISADGTNPQGEEIGSNVVGNVTGTLTVTGSTFAASDVTFDATSVSLQDVEAGGSFTATATGGPISLTTADAGGAIALTASGIVTATGLLQSGGDTTASGASLNLRGIAAGGDVDLTSTIGDIVTNGDVFGFNISYDAARDILLDANDRVFADRAILLDAGRDALVAGQLDGGSDVTVQAARDTRVANVLAGDDIRVTGGRSVVVGAANATGGGVLDNEGNGNNIVLISAGTLETTGIIEAANLASLRGTTVTTQIVRGGPVSITSTVGDVNLGGDIAGLGGVTIDSAGDILQGTANRIAGAGNGPVTLTADGDVAVGDVAGGAMQITAAGGVSTQAISGGIANIQAGDAILVGGDVTLRAGFTAQGTSIDFGANNISSSIAGDLDLTATGGDINATGTIDFNGAVTADASGAANLTGGITALLDVAITGGSVTVSDVTSELGNVSLTATAGGIAAPGTIDAGRDIFITTADGGAFGSLIAGDDIDIHGSGDVSVAFMDATGDDPDAGEFGSNVTIDLAGNVTVGHGEAAGDFIVNANSFATGLNSIIADGNIAITTSGASNLGNSTAGGSIQVAAQSIAFNALDAGDFVNLNATGATPGAAGIAGGSILAGTDVFLIGSSIAVGTIEAGGLLSAFGSGGDVAIDNATAASNIGVIAAGNVTGSYAAGGDIEMSAGGNIAVAANAAGGAPDPSNGDVNTAGNLFIDAAGDVALTGSGAGMVGVRAGGSAALTGVTAGEDMLVLAGTTAGLSSITVGDDLDVVAGGDVSAFGVSATAEGPDGFQLAFSSTGGFTIGQGEGVSSTDGADIDIRSTGGAVQAGGLSAGDDIFLTAASGLSVSGATTRGLGQTGGASSIRTQSGGDATLAGLDAFTDVVVQSDGAVGITGPVRSGRDTSIAADNVTVATLSQVNAGNTVLIDTIVAGRDLDITAAGAVDTGALRAGRDLAITGGTTVNVLQAVNGAGGTLALDGADGVTGDRIASGGATSLISSDGAIEIATLSSAGPVAASGDSIRVTGNGDLVFSQLDTDVGDAFVSAGGNLSVTAGSVAGAADLRARSGDLSVTQLTANSVRLESDDDMTLGAVTAAETLLGEAGGVLAVNGAVVGQQMSLGSADIVIAANGRLGTQGITTVLDVRNTDEDATTFVGGTGSRDGYHIDAGEMARLFGNEVTIFAPVLDGNDSAFVAAAPGALPVPIASVGSSTPPAVVIDDFTMTAGSSSSNLGASGSLTIATPGKARVIGDVLLTGMSDANAFRISADDSIEVILGEGTIRLTGGSSTSGASTPGGMLFLESEDVIVATADAIADVAAAADIDAIDERLGQNDGIVLDDGALFAGGMDVSVVGGFYVQNSGTGTRFAERRGLTFGALGLNVNVEGADSRIVINGVHLGPSGRVTGLDAIPLLSIDGFVIGSGPLSGSGLAFDSGSTMNGCLIVSSTTCSFLEFESSFPVQDVINDEDDEDQEGDDAEGMSLPTPLITMRDLDPLTGEPLLDDPVTGAGNDDLWTPPAE